MAILESAAWYALTDEELDEIVSCNDLPVLEGVRLQSVQVSCASLEVYDACRVKGGFSDRGFSSGFSLGSAPEAPGHDYEPAIV